MRFLLGIFLSLLLCVPAFARDTVDGYDSDTFEITEHSGISAPSVSPSGHCRDYFDSTSNTWKVSQNGGAYSDVMSNISANNTYLSKSGANANQDINISPWNFTAWDITALNNATADFYYGDGSKLTGIQQGDLILYFLNSTDPALTTNKTLSSIPNTTEVVLGGTNFADGDTLMGQWITPSGVPGITLFPSGVYMVDVAGNRTGTKVVKFWYGVYKTDANGANEVLISNSSFSNELTTTKASYRIYTANLNNTIFNTSNRIRVKGYANVTGVGTAPNVYAYVQGDSLCRIEFPVGAVSIENFVPYNGSIYDVDLGAKNITTTGNVTAGFFEGDGSLLTGLPGGGNVTGAGASSKYNISAYNNTAGTEIYDSGVNITKVLTVNNNTGDLPEGSNLYYTEVRWNSSLAAIQEGQYPNYKIVSDDLKNYTLNLTLKAENFTLDNDKIVNETINGSRKIANYSIAADDLDNTTLTDRQRKEFNFHITVTEPDLLTNATGQLTRSIPVWVNNDTRTYTISEVQSLTDVDNYNFTLAKSFNYTNMTANSVVFVANISIADNGESCFTNKTASFANATIEAGKRLIFQDQEDINVSYTELVIKGNWS